MVQSSNLLSVGYNELTRILEIEFKKSGIYQYFAVPLGVFNDLMNSDSKGIYFDRNIKSKYSYEKK
jgi:hypothetical protein